MRAERNPLGILQVFTDLGEHRAILFRHRVSDGIRQIQDSCARFHRSPAHLAKEIDVGSPGILGRELHLTDMLPAVTNHRADSFESLLTSHLQLDAKVYIGSREKNMQ